MDAPPTPPEDSRYGTQTPFDVDPQDAWLTAHDVDFKDLIQHHNRVSIPVAADEKFKRLLYNHVSKSLKAGIDIHTAIKNFVSWWKETTQHDRTTADNTREALAGMEVLPVEQLAILHAFLSDRTETATNGMIRDVLPHMRNQIKGNSKLTTAMTESGAGAKTKTRVCKRDQTSKRQSLVSKSKLRRSLRLKEQTYTIVSEGRQLDS